MNNNKGLMTTAPYVNDEPKISKLSYTPTT